MTVVSRPHRHGKNSEIIQQQAERIDALENVLQKFLNSQYHILTGYINRGNFVCSCTYCEFWWHKGEPESHHENCPVQLARELLGDTDES
jgi:hypothetical protein